MAIAIVSAVIGITVSGGVIVASLVTVWRLYEEREDSKRGPRCSDQ